MGKLTKMEKIPPNRQWFFFFFHGITVKATLQPEEYRAKERNAGDCYDSRSPTGIGHPDVLECPSKAPLYAPLVLFSFSCFTYSLQLIGCNDNWIELTMRFIFWGFILLIENWNFQIRGSICWGWDWGWWLPTRWSSGTPKPKRILISWSLRLRKPMSAVILVFYLSFQERFFFLSLLFFLVC